MAKYRIALVNPPSLGVIEPWQDSPEFGRNSLTYLAGYLLNKSVEYDIKIIDSKLQRLNFEDTIKEIIDFKPVIVGYTAFTNEIKPAAYIAAKLKQTHGNIINVIGGAHVTALPMETLKEFYGFDICVAGEGEVTFYELCEAICKQNILDSVSGIYYRNNGEIKKNKERNRLLNQDEIPMPAWHLLPKANVYWVQTQRGCPLHCVFCMNHNGRVARKTSINKVINEVEYIINTYKPEWIRFGDELFTVDMNRTMEFLDEWIERGLSDKVKWDIQTHVNYVNYEMFLKFKEAGCSQIDLGVETGDAELLKKMGKGTNLNNIISAYRSARKAKVTTGAFFLFGQPNESLKTILTTIALSVKINPDIPMFAIMAPYPGTKVAKLAAENQGGYHNLNYDWDQYRKQISGAVTFANLSRTKIEILLMIGTISVFLFNFRFVDFFKFIIKYSTEGLLLLKKIITGKNKVLFDKKPFDYDDILMTNYTIDKIDMVNSYNNFDDYQKQELLRSKKERPDLIKDQIPIN